MTKTTCPSNEEIARAAQLLRAGKLVAFPTETVYGLGANALDATAVRRIFEAKGRPETSPLIVHVDSIEMARRYALKWPPEAERLALRYWPGPLTLVVPKTPQIPDIVTAGLNTVGLRMPDHPVALALIRAAGVPVAAPSANRFGQLSPTTAEHVRRGLGDAVDMILDGGPARVGIESTVVSLCGSEPVVLRPGMIAVEAVRAAAAGEGAHPAPGMSSSHYRPKTRLLLVSREALPQGRGVYVWWKTPREARDLESARMPEDAGGYAAALYSMLHRLDAQGFDWIAVERPPDGPEWEGVRDRLTRAAG
jgi:L-threonylcarbamoyladenylate synthase